MSLRLVNDLPIRWDGRPVVWRGWQWLGGFVCPPAANDCCCERCGSDKRPSLNLGLLGDEPEMSRAEAVANDKAVKFGAKKRRAWLRLTAFRCPDCGQDQVLDDDGNWWNLDANDYSDDGSWKAS